MPEQKEFRNHPVQLQSLTGEVKVDDLLRVFRNWFIESASAIIIGFSALKLRRYIELRTVQEWLVELDAEELLDEYFREHPIDFEHMEEDKKKMRVCDIQEKGRKKLRTYIEYLRTLPIKCCKDDKKCLLYVFRMLYGFSARELTHELVYIDELLRDGIDTEAYSYVLTDPAEVIGFYVADTPLTQHYIVYLIANVLFNASSFGWTSEDVNREQELTFMEDPETYEEDDIDWTGIFNRETDPIEQDSPEEKRLREKAKEAVHAYYEKSRKNELQQIIDQLS